MDSEKRNEKWWKRWKLLRLFYHPMLMATDNDYVKWMDSRKHQRPSRRLVHQQMSEAENTVSPFRKSAEEFVGCRDIVDEVLSSVHYWIFEDEEFKSICPAPPPKVFIIKGSSGMGKTSLVHSVMVEAFEQGKTRGVPVFASSLSPHKIYEKWLGESEKRLARAFDQAFSRPTILFIDEAHSFTQHQDEGKSGDSGMQAYMSVQTTLLEKVNELINQDQKCILIFASNEFGSMLEAVRRRGSSGTIDLDSEVDRNVLISIAERNIQKFNLRHLNANDVLKTIEGKVRALGHSSITPADITNAFQIVIEKKTKKVRSSYVRRFSSALNKDRQAIQITLDDFREIRQLKEYNEDRRSEDIRHIVTKIRPKITLDQVGGLSGIKEQMLKDIEISLDPEQARRVGASPIHGVLLHGHPGCGKTWLAQAIAGELDATIYMVRGSQIIKPYHGQTEKIITDVFDEARKNAPSIIIIDEVDSLTLKRDMGGSLGAVTTLLSEMGGLKPLEGVVVIATTNKLHLVDEAFLRAGRFDRIVEIPPPRNDRERMEIVKVHLDRCETFLDSSVSPESIIELFGKRTFTPARIERLISDAIELRVKELNAVFKLSQVNENVDGAKLKKIRHIYEDDLNRLGANLGFSPQVNLLSDKIPEAIKSITPETYKLSLTHFKAAVEMSKDEKIEEIQRITLALRGPKPDPTIGKVYGLAALSNPSDSGSIASEGAVAVIECVCNPYGKRGRSMVIGSEVAKSVKASAEHARVFLNEQSDWAIRDYEFFVDFITFAKGMDSQVIQGPSAGAAITLAQYSVAAREPVLPNVVITGGVTPKGELVQVGGLDFKGMGKFVAALNTEGVDTIIIPEANYAIVVEEDRLFFERQGLKIISGKDFWDVAKAALASHPEKNEAISKLISRSDEYKKRAEEKREM
ncbi:MAG TPA: AAA family ATPase [Nitrososphaerales archaeon]|nr:AAA family ATPase [Nitrososphaerales archaeon]